MIRRPTTVQLGHRQFRIVDQTLAPIGKDFRPLGMVLIALSVVLLILVDYGRDPLIPLAITMIAVVGVVIVARVKLWPKRTQLLDIDLSQRVFAVPVESSNGGGLRIDEYAFDEVDELLFAMKETPINPKRADSVTIDAFSLYIRTFDGDLVPVIDATLDQDRAFRVARFLGDALDVGIKQVGKGWRT